MNNATAVMWCLLFLVITCVPVVRACEDQSKKLACASDFTTAIQDLTNPKDTCPHVTSYETCLNQACGSLTEQQKDQFKKYRKEYGCSGTGAVAFSPLLLMGTIVFVVLNVVHG